MRGHSIHYAPTANAEGQRKDVAVCLLAAGVSAAEEPWNEMKRAFRRENARTSEIDISELPAGKLWI